MDFRITGLPPEPFRPLFALEDAELERRGMRRCFADANPGYPCRVSLEDAAVGEELLLVPFEHQDAASPYRASGPVFVRKAALERYAAVNVVPEQLVRRLLSVRAYDAAGMMRGADVCEGRELEGRIARYFSDPGVAYLHVHNAKPGCFACRVDRVTRTRD